MLLYNINYNYIIYIRVIRKIILSGITITEKKIKNKIPSQ